MLPPDGLPSVRVSARIGPAVFGRGWIEAVSDEAIAAQETRQAAQGGDVSGRANRLADGRIGRLGVKARLADLETFTADAFHGDMGLTSPRLRTEVPNPDGLTDDLLPGVDLTDETVRLAAGYVRRLAIPARRLADAHGRASLFASVGCADCHAPSLRTRADFSVAAMAGRDAEVYSDLLLHDMGATLADGVDRRGRRHGARVAHRPAHRAALRAQLPARRPRAHRRRGRARCTVRPTLRGARLRAALRGRSPRVTARRCSPS